ncbi:SIMPL domain-containing protein [Alteromonas sp. ASW11-19]|uniref:SIMPL domain-containing protein n=1 Tax=Alteromonas salexigens TaxID=2982530 RepID=A0ABT2VMU5_9ALTE|nr:SIMPL domain-containing protein [Alteromonas salexigens]MCU7554177.1 SIMPL domain-containing protein [Alteromonas salexigens]
MKNVLKSCAAALLLTVPAAQVMAQSSAVPAIHVQGQGSVAVTPDGYTVTFIFENSGETVAKLSQRLNHEVEEVVAFLQSKGIAETDIQSMQVGLHPRYENSPQGRKQSGFTLSREVQISHSDISSYDIIIDGVLARGVDRIQSFRFTSSQQDGAYDKALVAAIKDAKARASLMAAELDVALGKVLTVSESGGNAPVPMMHARSAESMSGALPGQQQVQAQLNVSFSIQQ